MFLLNKIPGFPRPQKIHRVRFLSGEIKLGLQLSVTTKLVQTELLSYVPLVNEECSQMLPVAGTLAECVKY